MLAGFSKHTDMLDFSRVFLAAFLVQKFPELAHSQGDFLCTIYPTGPPIQGYTALRWESIWDHFLALEISPDITQSVIWKSYIKIFLF